MKSSDYLSLVRDRKDIIVVIILLSHGIYMDDNWRPGGKVLWFWTWLGNRARLGLHLFHSCQLRTVPLLWMVDRSQTYYPEHILAYGSGKACCSLVMGFGFFWTD